jgi:SAM-dependent methyltransferase
MKLYDKKNKRLILIDKKADSGFWDAHWQTDNFIKEVKSGINNKLVKNITDKCLYRGAKVLEGGCGIGQNVYALNVWGYDSFGVDFAPQIVKRINSELPDLKVSLQDVKKMKFPDNYFDGYWSFGVIEHFWNGYGDILNEAQRVLKDNGFLFMSFPYMSPLRRLKAKFNTYKIWENNFDIKEFYEFILDKENVENEAKKFGFKSVASYPFSATKGIKDEIAMVQPFMQKIYDSPNIFAKIIRFGNSILFSHIAAHSIIIVFTKNGNKY